MSLTADEAIAIAALHAVVNFDPDLFSHWTTTAGAGALATFDGGSLVWDVELLLLDSERIGGEPIYVIDDTGPPPPSTGAVLSFVFDE